MEDSINIHLLLGNDYYSELLLSNTIHIQPNLYLLESKLGWIISGRTSKFPNECIEPINLTLSNIDRRNTVETTPYELEFTQQNHSEIIRNLI